MLRSLFHVLAFAGLAAAVVIGLFIAWWIAVCAVLGIAAYVSLMRLLGARGVSPVGAGAGHGPVVIEGQFQVEPETPATGRVLEHDENRR